MSEVSEGGVILPGGIPVDPADPTKGTIQPVMSAQQLTQAVLTALAGQEALNETLYGFAGAVRGSLLEAAERLEDAGIVIDYLIELAGDEVSENLPDPVDEAHQRLLEYVSNIAGARAEADQAEAPSIPTEQNDSEAAADDATWD